MNFKIVFTLTFIFNCCFLFAQEVDSFQPTKSWSWDNFKIGFNVPTDLVVKESSDKVFYAGSAHVFLTIYPKKGENLTQGKMQPALEKWAVDHKVTFSASNSSFLTNSSRLWNYYSSGTGYKGMATYVALLVDSTHPQDSYYVWLQYDNGYAGAAMSILNSFTPQ